MKKILRVLTGEEERALTTTQKVREALMGGSASSAGVRVTQSTALSVSTVYACTRVLAESVASLPLHKYRRLEEGRLRLLDDPAIRLLTVAPNEYMTAYEWRELMMFYLCLRGNSFNRVQRNGAGQAIAIYPMHPDSIQMKFEDDGSLIYIWKPKNKESMRLPARDVIHVKGLSTDGLIGLSPLDTMAEQVGYAYAMQQYGARLFANDARPSGVLQHPGELDDETYKRVAKSWNDAHSGKKQHSVAILEDDMEYKPIGITPEHAQFLESKKLSRSEIAGAFKVPPHMIGDLDKATFSNIEKQDMFFAKHTIAPWAERIEQVLINRLIPVNKQGDEYYEHSLDGLLRGDIETRYKSYALLWDRGIINANEIRSKENLNPIEDGDKYYVPLNFVSTDETVAPAPDVDRSQPLQLVPKLKTGRDCGCGEDHETRAENPAEREAEKIKIAKDRQQIIASFQPLLEDAMVRVVRRESQHLKAAAKKHLKRSQQEFETFVTTFYQDTSYTEQQVAPAFEALRQALGADVYREINEEWEDNPALQGWADQYVQTFAAHHALSGRSQIEKLIAETKEDLYEVLDQRFDEWVEGGPSGSTRALKVSSRETTRFGNAFAMVALSGAVAEARFVWRATGETCPICIDMDGVTVGYGEPFADGSESNLKDANGEPFKPSGPVLNPPLHSGCDCVVTLE